MSDQQTDATSQDEEQDVATPTAQDAATDEQAPTPPWGEDDFDPDRAWKLVSNLRAEKESLKARAEQFDRLREDPDAFREIATELGYQFEDDDTDDTEEPDDPNADVEPLTPSQQRELWEFKQQQVAREEHQRHVDAVIAINEQLDELAEPDKIELSESDRKYLIWEAATSSDKGLTPESVEAAYKRLAGEREALRKRLLGEVVDSKGTPPVSPGGTEGTQVPDLSDDAARQAWMVERLSQGRSAS